MESQIQDQTFTPHSFEIAQRKVVSVTPFGVQDLQTL